MDDETRDALALLARTALKQEIQGRALAALLLRASPDPDAAAAWLNAVVRADARQHGADRALTDELLAWVREALNLALAEPPAGP